MAAAPALGDTVAQKRAQAQQVLAQINQTDVQLEQAIQRYDGASVQLDKIHAQLRINGHDLKVSRANLRFAQHSLAARLHAIYVSGQDASTLEVLLGAQSLDDFINRVDTVDRVSSEDAVVLRQVKHFRLAVQRQAQLLRQARIAQEHVVAARAAEKAAIQSQLAQRKQLLSSIKDEIVKLQAQERARQAQLQRDAQARLAAQQAAQQRALNNTAVGTSAVTPDGAPVVAPPGHYGGVVGIAMQYLGTPYVWGGAAPGGFDCSGLVMYVYAQVGVSLPHYTGSQWQMGVPVSRDQLQPGDLVFFYGLGHVGIYIGGGQFIHAPHTGDVVKISSMDESGYSSSFDGARRIL